MFVVFVVVFIDCLLVVAWRLLVVVMLIVLLCLFSLYVTRALLFWVDWWVVLL